MFFFFKQIVKKNRSIVIANKTLQNCVKQGSVYFLLCPKQGPIIEGVVLHRVCILGYFCPKQGQLVKPSAAPLYPTTGKVLPGTMRMYCLIALNNGFLSRVTSNSAISTKHWCSTAYLAFASFISTFGA